jgi:hypothetical protein
MPPGRHDSYPVITLWSCLCHSAAVPFDWMTALDFKQAATNLKHEEYGDWHVDPWGWPEIQYLTTKGNDALREFCSSDTVNEVSLLDVPKESWGTRPAVVLTPIDRLVYQALVDSLSVDITGDLTPNAFGWRLPATDPKKGQYSHNNFQWELYRSHLESNAAVKPVTLKTDIVSCFASMSIDAVQAELDLRTPSNHISKRLLALLGQFGQTRSRSGLPQRSTASALIANMIMSRLDDVLEHHSSAIPVMKHGGVQYHSFARWMDDMWLFVDDAGQARRAQVELQRSAEEIGLYLNAAKTDVLEGFDALQEVDIIEHSAVDAALSKARPDHGPLQELIERIIDSPEKTGRTSIRFAALRMASSGNRHRAQELAEQAKRMPHAADALAPLFKRVFLLESLEEWFLEYVEGDWAGFEWTISHYLRMFGAEDSRPTDKLVDYMARLVENPSTSLPLLAAASQRLSVLRPATARTVMRAAARTANSAHVMRILSLAALNAGETKRTVNGWIRQHDSNRVIAEMLTARNAKVIPVVQSYRA